MLVQCHPHFSRYRHSVNVCAFFVKPKIFSTSWEAAALKRSAKLSLRPEPNYTVGHLNSPLAHTISSPVHLISSLVHLISSLTHLISSFAHSIRHMCISFRQPCISFRHAKIWLQCRAGADQTRLVNFCPPCTSFAWFGNEMLADHKNELITLSVIG